MTYKRPRHVRSSSAEDSDANPDDEDLAAFFSITNLRRFSALERKRLRNLKLNYETLTSMGLLVERPDFMKSKRKRFCQEGEDVRWKGDNSDANDPEWTPSMELYEVPVRTRKDLKLARKPLRKNKTKVSKLSSRDEVTLSADFNIPQEVPSPPLTRPSNKLRRFIPTDEQELYCEDCGLDYLDECPFHGPLTIVKNTKATAGGREHAWHTLPACLSVWPSKIPGAGLGVWTNELIHKRTRFGPYEGDLITDWDRAEASGYCWKIGRGDLFVDAKNQETSNWLRYVNCCRSVTEQNLIAYQYRGQIYYRTIVDVPPDTELLVWYGNDYGRELGVKQEQMYNSFFYPHKRKSTSPDPVYHDALWESDSEKRTWRKCPEVWKDAFISAKSARKMKDERNLRVKEQGSFSPVTQGGGDPEQGDTAKDHRLFSRSNSNVLKGSNCSPASVDQITAADNVTMNSQPKVSCSKRTRDLDTSVVQRVENSPCPVSEQGFKPESCKECQSFQGKHSYLLRGKSKVPSLSPEHLVKTHGEKPESCEESKNSHRLCRTAEQLKRTRGAKPESCKEDRSGYSKQGKQSRQFHFHATQFYSDKAWSVQKDSCNQLAKEHCELSVSTENKLRASSQKEKPCAQLSENPDESSVSTENKVRSCSEKKYSCAQLPKKPFDSPMSAEDNLRTRSGKIYSCAQLERKPHQNFMQTCSRKKDSCVQLTEKPSVSSLSSESAIKTCMRNKASEGHEHKNALSESLCWRQRNECVPCIVLLECLKMKPISISAKPEMNFPLDSCSSQKSAEKRAGDVQSSDGDVTSKVCLCEDKKVHPKTLEGIHSLTDREVQGKSPCNEDRLEEAMQSIRNSRQFTKMKNPKGNKVCQEEKTSIQESLQASDNEFSDEIPAAIQDEPKSSHITSVKIIVESSTDGNGEAQTEREEIQEELQAVNEVLPLDDKDMVSDDTANHVDTGNSRGLDCQRGTCSDINGISSDNIRDFSHRNGEDSGQLGQPFRSEDIWVFYSSLNLDCGFEINRGDCNREMCDILTKKQCQEKRQKCYQIRTGCDFYESELYTSFDEDFSELQMGCDSRSECPESQGNCHFTDRVTDHPVDSKNENYADEQMEDSCLDRYKCYQDHSTRISNECSSDCQMENWCLCDLRCCWEKFGPCVSSDHKSQNDLAQGHHPLWQIYSELNTDIRANISNLQKQLIY